MGGIDSSYIVHCAVTKCTMGLRESKLVLEESHGVFLKGKAQVAVEDAKADENIICFGGCKSKENPGMEKTLREMADKIDKDYGVSYQTVTDADLQKLLEEKTEDGISTMVCYTECKPLILTPKWDKEKEDVYVEQGKKALHGKAYIICEYGGTITIETTGQEE